MLLGPVLPGEKSYAETVESAMCENRKLGGRWLTALDNNNPLLPSAYAACRIFALFSSCETQPLAVMQAMACRKPVVVLRAAYMQDPLFSTLPASSSNSLDDVVRALRSNWEDPSQTELPHGYNWNSVAASLIKIYSQAGVCKT